MTRSVSNILESSPMREISSLSPLQRTVDGLVGSSLEQSTDWKSLMAMTAGGLAYRMGRIGLMGLGGGNGLRALSVAVGLGAEVSSFEGVHRGLESLGAHGHAPLHANLWSWNGAGGLRQGLLQSFISFGALKGAGRLARGENLVAQHFLQDTAMVFGHQASGILGIAPRPAGNLAEQFLHAEATNLQIGAGMALAERLSGGRISAIERGLELLHQVKSIEAKEGDVFPPSPYQWAKVSGEAQLLRKKAGDPKSHLLLMTGESKPPDLNQLILDLDKLVQLAYDGNETAINKCRNYDIRPLVRALSADSSFATFLAEMAKFGNSRALDFLQNMEVSDLARKAKTDSDAINFLNTLAEAGNIKALKAIEILDVSAFSFHPSPNDFYVLGWTAELGNRKALNHLLRLAKTSPDALLGLLLVQDKKLLEKKGADITPLLRKLDVEWPSSKINAEAIDFLKSLSSIGNAKAKAKMRTLVLPPLAKEAENNSDAMRALVVLTIADNPWALRMLKGLKILQGSTILEIFKHLGPSHPSLILWLKELDTAPYSKTNPLDLELPLALASLAEIGNPFAQRTLETMDLTPLILFAKEKTPKESKEQADKDPLFLLMVAGENPGEYGLVGQMVLSLYLLYREGHPKAAEAMKNLDITALKREIDRREKSGVEPRLHYIALTVLAENGNRAAFQLLVEKAKKVESAGSTLGTLLLLDGKLEDSDFLVKSAYHIFGGAEAYNLLASSFPRYVTPSTLQTASQALSTAARKSIIAARYLPSSSKK